MHQLHSRCHPWVADKLDWRRHAQIHRRWYGVRTRLLRHEPDFGIDAMIRYLNTVGYAWGCNFRRCWVCVVWSPCSAIQVIFPQPSSMGCPSSQTVARVLRTIAALSLVGNRLHPPLCIVPVYPILLRPCTRTNEHFVSPAERVR